MWLSSHFPSLKLPQLRFPSHDKCGIHCSSWEMWERKPSPALFLVVWGTDTLDPSHGLNEQPWASGRDRICQGNEVCLHPMEVLQLSCGSEAGNLGFVGFRRGRRLIPGLTGADWSITTMVRAYTLSWIVRISVPKSLLWA